MGNTYYVSTTGSDSNNCTQAQSTSTPKLTLASALACCTADNGDTVQMRGGTYAVGLIDPPSSSSYAGGVTITNYPGETVTINGIDTDPALWMTGLHTYITIKGDTQASSSVAAHFIIDAAPSSSGNCIKWTSVAGGVPTPNHIRLENMELKGAQFSGVQTADRGTANEGFFDFKYIHVHHCGTRANLDHGFYLESPSNLVEHCDSHDNAAYGLQFDNGPSNNSIARYNTIYNNAVIAGGGGGVYLHNTGNGPIEFYDNLIYNNNDGTNSNGYGIQVRTQGSLVYNNTFYANVGINMYVLDPESSGSFIRNNIIYGVVGSPGNDVRLESCTNITFENNLVGSSSITRIADSGTVLANNLLGSNPQFISTSVPNFRLQANSPAIGAGQNLSSTFTTDYTGATRTVPWDIGAYAYIFPTVASTVLAGKIASAGVVVIT